MLVEVEYALGRGIAFCSYGFWFGREFTTGEEEKYPVPNSKYLFTGLTRFGRIAE
jgi:hypothetical protein